MSIGHFNDWFSCQSIYFHCQGKEFNICFKNTAPTLNTVSTSSYVSLLICLFLYSLLDATFSYVAFQCNPILPQVCRFTLLAFSASSVTFFALIFKAFNCARHGYRPHFVTNTKCSGEYLRRESLSSVKYLIQSIFSYPELVWLSHHRWNVFRIIIVAALCYHLEQWVQQRTVAHQLMSAIWRWNCL